MGAEMAPVAGAARAREAGFGEDEARMNTRRIEKLHAEAGGEGGGEGGGGGGNQDHGGHARQPRCCPPPSVRQRISCPG